MKNSAFKETNMYNSSFTINKITLSFNSIYLKKGTTKNKIIQNIKINRLSEEHYDKNFNSLYSSYETTLRIKNCTEKSLLTYNFSKIKTNYDLYIFPLEGFLIQNEHIDVYIFKRKSELDSTKSCNYFTSKENQYFSEINLNDFFIFSFYLIENCDLDRAVRLISTKSEKVFKYVNDLNAHRKLLLNESNFKKSIVEGYENENELIPHDLLKENVSNITEIRFCTNLCEEPNTIPIKFKENGNGSGNSEYKNRLYGTLVNKDNYVAPFGYVDSNYDYIDLLDKEFYFFTEKKENLKKKIDGLLNEERVLQEQIELSKKQMFNQPELVINANGLSINLKINSMLFVLVGFVFTLGFIISDYYN